MALNDKFGRILRLLTVVLAVGLVGCEDFEGQTILSGEDAPTRTQITVKSKLHGGYNRVHIEVKRDGKEIRQVIADDAQVHRALLVRYNQWFLVLSGPYVLGGYDVESGQIAPMNSRSLPFTSRTVSGYRVDEKQVAEGEDVPPDRFESRLDR